MISLSDQQNRMSIYRYLFLQKYSSAYVVFSYKSPYNLYYVYITFLQLVINVFHDHLLYETFWVIYTEKLSCLAIQLNTVTVHTYK